ncbi:MAG: HU family DNA-binding protein [Pseudomonadota bacterium]
MNKAELIEEIAAKAMLTKADAERAFTAVIDTIVDAVKNGSEVSVTGFGTFKANNRAARSGRNPRTGETIQIAASRVPAFKAGKSFKDAVNI